jgi:hypothetical protein
MPLKRRRPLQRQVSITPRALQLFLELQRHERSSDGWYDVHLLLHRELACKPWEYPLDSAECAAHIWSALEAAAAAAAERKQLVAAK